MLDIIFFIFLLIFSVLGFFRGHNKEIKSVFILLIFFPLCYFYASNIGFYFFSKINFDLNILPSHSDIIVGAFFIYLFIILLLHLFVKYFFISFVLLENVFFSKLIGLLLGFIKGIILISYFIVVIIYFNNLDHIYNFDKNSLFLDYFLNFGVQLQNVWNHWYS